MEFEGKDIGVTMEPGLDDRDFPRLPAGFYHCTPHGWEPDSQRRLKRTWAMNGADASQDLREKGLLYVSRIGCAFHGGADDEDSKGCTMRGESIDRSGPRPLLIGSGTAMERMRSLIGNRDFYLTIHE